MTRRSCSWVDVSLVSGLATVGVLASVTIGTADEARLVALGKRLSPECTSCHKEDGKNEGIPSIVGWRTREFVMTMEYYQRGDRRHQVMNSVAQSLDGEQVEALAAYFGSLPRPPRKTAAPTAPK